MEHLENELEDEDDNEYESMLTRISSTGVLYRWFMTMMIAVVAMKSGFDIFVLNLATVEIPHYCNTVKINNISYSWGFVETNFSQILTTQNFSNKNYICMEPHFENSLSEPNNYELVNITSKCNSWTFYPEWSARWNIMQEFQMVCDRSYLKDRIQTILQSGIFIATLFGLVGDIIGRKTLLLTFCFLDLICNTIAIFVVNLEAQMILRFFMGFGAPAELTALVLTTEIVSEEYRGLHGNLIWILWVAGYVGSAAIAYFIAHWKHQLIVIVCIIGSVYATYPFIMPESPRWLLTKQKTKRAKNELIKLAKLSGCKETVEEFDFKNNSFTRRSNSRVNGIYQYFPKEDYCNARYLITMFCVCFISFTISLVYFAMSLQRDFITKNPYLNVTISGLIEFPAYIAAWLLTNKAGRKYSAFGCFAFCGIGLIVLPHLSESQTSVISTYSSLAILLKLAIACGFSIFGVYMSEVLPTTVRSMSFFVGCGVLRLGQTLAPELGYRMLSVNVALPLTVYGIITLLAAASVLVLPETNLRPMPNSIAEMYELGITCVRNGRESRIMEVEAEENPKEMEKFIK